MSNCKACGHSAWAHGDQSGFPSNVDPCYAALDLDAKKGCTCKGYVDSDTYKCKSSEETK
jgi:hypothetical protein